jgi:hypothetical protein
LLFHRKDKKPASHYARTEALNPKLAGFFTSTIGTASASTDAVFQMSVDGYGEGSYFWNFDLTGLPGLSTDDISNITAYGLQCKFIESNLFVVSVTVCLSTIDHIYENWNAAELSGTSCGASVVGYHYDPYLACGPKSEYKDTLCSQLNRTAAAGYRLSAI